MQNNWGIKETHPEGQDAGRAGVAWAGREREDVGEPSK